MKKCLKLLITVLVLYSPNVMAMTCANNGDKLVMTPDSGNNIEINQQIPQLVHIVILIIKIAIPIILIILGMLDLLKGVTASKEDEIKKAQNMFFKRLIAAILVFFVVTIVQLLISYLDTNNEGIMSCANCFINGKCEEEAKFQCAYNAYNANTGETFSGTYIITSKGTIVEIYDEDGYIVVDGNNQPFAGQKIKGCPTDNDEYIFKYIESDPEHSYMEISKE